MVTYDSEKNTIKRANLKSATKSSGARPGIIISAEVKQKPDYFSQKKEKTVLELKISVTDVDGAEVHVYYSPSFNWDPRGNMFKLLEELGALPEVDQELSLDDLCGLEVIAEISNNVTPTRTFSNVKSVRKIDSQQVSATESTEEKLSIETQISNISEYKSVSPDEILGVDLDLD